MTEPPLDTAESVQADREIVKQVYIISDRKGRGWIIVSADDPNGPPLSNGSIGDCLATTRKRGYNLIGPPPGWKRTWATSRY